MKKRIFSVLLALITMFLLLAIPVGAADLTGSFTYENERLIITGSNATAYGLVSIYVLGATIDSNTVSDSVRPVVVDVVLANSTGGYTAEILLPSNLSTNQYKLHIANGTNTWESIVFNHINAGELNSLLFNINHSATSDEIKEFLEPLNIALELPNVTYTSEYLYEVRPDSGYTDAQLQTEMQRSNGLYLLQQGATPEELLAYESYLKDSLLQIDCLEQYQNMTDDIKTNFLDKVSAMDLKTVTALEDIYGVGLVETLKTVTAWQDLQNTIQGTDETNLFFENKISANTNYGALKYPELVYQELYRKKDQLTDITAVKTIFASVVATLYTNQQNSSNKNNSSQGSSGGGYTSWGPSASVVTKPKEESPTPTQIPTPTQTPVATPEIESPMFHDIVGHWAESAIKKMAELGVAKGYSDNSFCPDASVTRAEYVKLLCELFQINEVSDIQFSDVSADSWYETYVKSAATLQIVRGDENGNFHPNEAITRQDAAVILGRFLQLSETTVSGKFTDEASIASYASGYVAAMADAKLINGMTDGSFAPMSNTTRAQAVTLLLNAKTWLDNGRNGG